MRHTTKINPEIQRMSRLELIRKLHQIDPSAGWNTAATGTRTLRIALNARLFDTAADQS